MWHKLILDRLNATEICNQLTEEFLTPVADTCSVQSLLNSLFEGFTVLECLIVLRSQVIVLCNDIEFLSNFTNFIK